MKIFSVKPMPQDMADAVAFCVGPPVPKDACRACFMSNPFDPTTPHGLVDDHVCAEPKGHPGPHRYVRCGIEIANDTEGAGR